VAIQRCGWAEGDPLMLDYHDREWGVPVHDDPLLFEFLVLEGAQAGLSWMTILRKRDAYRRAFHSFEPKAVARFTDRSVARLLESPAIVRNRRKIESAITNARVILAITREQGSFDRYVWSFVGSRPRRNAWRTVADIPAQTPESVALSKDLVRRGASFVGPTICYAFMQATGLVNDHLVSCFRYAQLLKSPSPARGGGQGGGELRTRA
jgi:DNA-3-methyladenine glycosylase I